MKLVASEFHFFFFTQSVGLALSPGYIPVQHSSVPRLNNEMQLMRGELVKLINFAFTECSVHTSQSA